MCREACETALQDLLGVEKAMVSCHEKKILKNLVVLSKVQASKGHKLQARIVVAKQNGKVFEISTNDIVDSKFVEGSTIEYMVERLNSALVLADKEMRHNLRSKILLINPKGNIGPGGVFCKK